MADVSTSVHGDIKLISLTKSYGDFNAVDDISVTVPQGSFFALLGPSGCGKTTTLRMIAGLEDPTKGKIQIGNIDITNKRPYERPVNTVFQNYALFPHLSIYENIAFGLRRRGIKDIDEAVKKVLNLVELPLLADRKPNQLSGGQQQRIAIARALAGKPSILLVDEPTGNLDAQTADTVFDLMLDLAKNQGTACVSVTHDPLRAARCDRILHLDHGVLKEA